MEQSAAQQIKEKCRMWDAINQTAPVIIVTPELMSRLQLENEESVFYFEDEVGTWLLDGYMVTTADCVFSTNPCAFWLAAEEPHRVL